MTPTCRTNDCPYREADPNNPKHPVCALPHAKQVIYRGNLDSDVLVVGQSPGTVEVDQGVPFVGPAGKLLSRLLEEAGWNEKALLFSNAVFCCPAGNATPKKQQIDLCRTNTSAIFWHHPRKLVIMLGNEAKSAVFPDAPAKGVTKGAGTLEPHPNGAMTLWSVHPAAVLRSPDLESVLLADLRKGLAYFQGTVGVELPTIDWGVLTAEEIHTLSPPPDITLLAIDVETTGLDPWKDTLLGVGIGWRQESGEEHYRYVPLAFGDPPTSVWGMEEAVAVRGMLYEWLTLSVPKVLQNVNFDVDWIYRALHLDILPVAYDTMVEAMLVDENKPKGLKERATRHLNAPPWDKLWKDARGRTLEEYAERKELHLGMAPLEVVAKYCCYDCYYTLALHDFYQEHITEGQRKLQQHLLQPQMNQLLRITRRGMLVDIPGLRDLGASLEGPIKNITKQVNEIAGTSELHLSSDPKAPPGLNLSSVKQRQYLFYSLLDLSGLIPEGNEYRTEGGELSTANPVIEYLLSCPLAEKTDTILRLLKEHSRLVKIKTAFVDTVLRCTKPDGKVHPHFLQSGTVTGRLSCKDPNVMQITKDARPYFIAPEGYSYVEADFSAIEVVVWAEMTGDPVLLRVLQEEPDFHRWTVGMALRKNPEDVTDEERKSGKVLTFGGTMYGGGPPIIAKSMGVTIERAAELHENIQQLYPRATAWNEQQVSNAREKGFVLSLFGRIRRIAGVGSNDRKVSHHAEAMAMNSPIQATASDLTGLAALRVEKAWEEAGLDAWLVNIVHDSIVGIVRNDQVEEAKQLLETVMVQKPYKAWRTPLKVEVTVDERWGGTLDKYKLLEYAGEESNETEEELDV